MGVRELTIECVGGPWDGERIADGWLDDETNEQVGKVSRTTLPDRGTYWRGFSGKAETVLYWVPDAC
jgi:hypothetical protein